MTDRTPAVLVISSTTFLAIQITCISCAGPDFSNVVQSQTEAGVTDANPEDETIVICNNNCPDLTSATDAGDEGVADSLEQFVGDDASPIDAPAEAPIGDASRLDAPAAEAGTSDAADVIGAATCEASTVTLCAGVCADTRTDSRNCGSCGHNCLGGGCTAGQCQPVVLAASTYLDTHSTIAANAAGVFWTTGTNALNASPLPSAGSMYPLPAKTLASGLHIYQIALDALNVYWGDPYNSPPMVGTVPVLMKIPAAGGYPPATIASGGALGFPIGIALDSANLYVANELSILQVPLGGSTTNAIASANQAYVIVCDSANLYWTDSGTGSVMMMPKAGGQPLTLATSQPVATYYGGSALGVDSTNVYWLNNDGSVRAVSKSSAGSSPVTTLVSAGAKGIAVDNTSVYWTNVGSGAVMKTPTTGAPPSRLASNQTPVGALAADSTAVYWLGAQGVMALAK